MPGIYYQSGGSAGGGGGATDHGALTGLADDDHAQYEWLRTENVMRHGAVGDGVTDDTAAIDAAIAAAGAGGVVYFPEGVFLHDPDWNVTLDDITFYSYAFAELRCGGTAVSDFILVFADNVSFEGLTFNVNTADFPLNATHGNIYLVDSHTDFRVDNCRFIDSGGVCIAATGTTANPIERVEVTNSYFEVNTATAAAISFYDDVSNFKITGNTIIVTGNNATGIGASMVSDGALLHSGLIANNTITFASGGSESDSAAITTAALFAYDQRPENLVIANNVIEVKAGALVFAFLSVVTENTLVTGNVMRNLGSSTVYGIEIGCENSSITNNLVDGGDTMETLLIVNNSSRNLVQGNGFRGMSPTATVGNSAVVVYADDQGTTNCVHNTISGNTVETQGESIRGIQLVANHASANVDDNLVIGNTVSGDGNLSQGIACYAITGSCTRNIVQSNNVKAVAAAFLMGGTENALLDNKISDYDDIYAGTTATDLEVRGNSWQYAAAVPAADEHVKGEVVLNSTPSVGSAYGWRCVTAGTPGTWETLDWALASELATHEADTTSIHGIADTSLLLTTAHEAAADPHTGYERESALTEDVQDIVGAFATDSATIDFTYSDAGGTLSAAVIQSALDHGTIGGLSDDDHTQYALLAGRSGGQTLIGGTASGNDLTLESTSHATKGNIFVPLGSGVDLGASGSASLTANPLNDIFVTGTNTYGTGSDYPASVLVNLRTNVIDVALNAFAIATTFWDSQTYKSGANTTNRDLKQLWSFYSSPVIQADQSDDTFNVYNGFRSAPTFNVTGAGSPTLAATEANGLYSGATIGASVTLTTRRGLLVDPATVTGTLTKELGADLNVNENSVLLRMSRAPSNASYYECRQQDGTTSGAASVTFDFPTPSSTSAMLMRVYTLGHQTNGVEEVAIYEDLLRVKNTAGTVTVTAITQRLSEEVGTWSATPSASGTNVRMTCTGVAGDDITWVCQADYLAQTT